MHIVQISPNVRFLANTKSTEMAFTNTKDFYMLVLFFYNHKFCWSQLLPLILSSQFYGLILKYMEIALCKHIYMHSESRYSHLFIVFCFVQNSHSFSATLQIITYPLLSRRNFYALQTNVCSEIAFCCLYVFFILIFLIIQHAVRRCWSLFLLAVFSCLFCFILFNADFFKIKNDLVSLSAESILLIGRPISIFGEHPLRWQLHYQWQRWKLFKFE